MSLAPEQPLSATSTGTNRTNRGGRPKDWTDPRTRRLTRLYVYTSLRVEHILEVLKDDVWSPGKEAANKHLNHLLGKDPRWMRPKDVPEQRQRMAGLKKSERARGGSGSAPNGPSVPQDGSHSAFLRADTLDGTTLGRQSESSVADRGDGLPIPGLTSSNTVSFNLPAESNLRGLDRDSSASFSRFMPRIRNRQSTSLTTSTDFSVGSTKEEYHEMQQRFKNIPGYSSSDIKDVFRLLKKFTFSNETSLRQSPCSPRGPAGLSSSVSPPQPNGPQFEPVARSGVTNHLLPGDFLSMNLCTFNSKEKRDQFGNTMYHIHAASQFGEEYLISMVAEGCRDPLLGATNTGNQTFLHVLHESWFDNDEGLDRLLGTVRNAPSLDFYGTDVYGRNFFHILRQKVTPARLREIISTWHFDITRLNRRDAFGVKPMIQRASTMKEDRPTRLTIPNADRSQERIRDHTQLLRIINGVSSPNGRLEEDSQGRNALHCLSEVILGMAAIKAHANGTPVGKRKLDNHDEPLLQVCPLSQRLQYLDTVLQADVDVNHYNADGDTVLMSFVAHITDGQDDKDLELLIKRLVQAGANLEARNRNGETVLQVAARCGQKFAVKVLLEQGVNFHVRNCAGRSVLQMIDDYAPLSTEYPDQTARFEATRSVLTGRFSQYKAEQDPTLEQEWAVRPNVTGSPVR
ncbi:hypothetical protein BX600DRAFT_506846 [Xylariales sp. PMI_506]|nr:hypothetical protein BX600DRAFT_506846 [Xylariales sp. PMI_506]